MNTGILEPLDFSPRALTRLQQFGHVSLYGGGDLKAFLTDKDALFIRLKHFIGKNFLDLSKQLKYLCTPTTGLTHLDLNALQARDVHIVSLKDEREFLGQIRATPEHAFGLTLSLLRNYKSAFLSETNPEWDRNPHRGFEIFGSRVGLIGFGRVGRILGDYFHQFGAEVCYYDVGKVSSPEWAQRVDRLETLLSVVDIAVLAASYEPGRGPILHEAHLEQLKDKFFINIARGELIDETALLKKIRANAFKGIALDVIANENKANHRAEFIALTQGRNFILTPHIAGATFTSMHKTEEFIVAKLAKLLKPQSL